MRGEIAREGKGEEEEEEEEEKEEEDGEEKEEAGFNIESNNPNLKGGELSKH